MTHKQKPDREYRSSMSVARQSIGTGKLARFDMVKSNHGSPKENGNSSSAKQTKKLSPRSILRGLFAFGRSYGSVLHALVPGRTSDSNVKLDNHKDMRSYGSVLHALVPGRMSVMSGFLRDVFVLRKSITPAAPKDKRKLLAIVLTALLPVVAITGQLLKPTPASAAINEQLNFQARLLNDGGGLVPDGFYHVRFNIYEDGDGNLGGGDETLAWTEAHSTGNLVRVANGYLSVQLGSINNTLGSAVDWGNDTIWLSIEIGGDGGSPVWDGEMDPFMRLTSTPYAFNANNLDGRDSSEFVQLDPGATPQAVNTTNTAIAVNQTGAGNILQLQAGGNDAFTINNSGNAVFNNNVTIGDASSDRLTVTSEILGTNALVFQGATDDGFTTTLAIEDPTTDTTYILPSHALGGTYEICTSDGNCSDSGITLQAAYNNSSFAIITLDSTRGAVRVRDNATPLGTELFAVQSNDGNTSYLSVDVTGTSVDGTFGATGAVTLSSTLDVAGNAAIDGSLTVGESGLTDASIILNNDTGAFTTTIGATDATANRTITLPDATGTVLLNTTIGSTVFLQGGNSFGTTAILGTNDAQDLVFEVGGVSAVTIADEGAVTFQNEVNTTSGFRVLSLDGSHILNVDTSNNRVGIGAALPDARLNINGGNTAGTLHVEGGGSLGSGSEIKVSTYADDGPDYSKVKFYRSRGDEAVQTAVLSGDILGAIEARGFDTSESIGAEIQFVASADWGSGGDFSDAPTDIVFLGSNDANQTSFELLRLSAQNGIEFNAASLSLNFTIQSGTLANAFLLDGATGSITLGAYDCSGNLNGGVLTADASGNLVCADDDDSAATITLQDAYDASTVPATINTSDGKNIVFNLADTTVDTSLIINLQGADNTVRFQDNGTDAITVDSSGNLSLLKEATATSGSPQSSQDLILQGSAWDTDGALAVDRIITQRLITSDSNNADYRLGFLSDTGSEFVTFDGFNGRVGIGTTGPTEALEVAGNLRLDPAAGDPTISLVTSGGIQWTFNTSSGLTLADNSGGGSHFTIQNNGNVILNQSGNVGIGDSTPDARLDVQTGSAASTGLIIQGAASQTADMVQILNDTGGELFVIEDDGTATFRADTNSSASFIIQNAGGTSLFTADSTNNRIYVGNPTPDSTGTILVLDSKNTAGDPTGVNGALYYNSNINKFRCFENGSWGDCGNLPRTGAFSDLTDDTLTDASTDLWDQTTYANIDIDNTNNGVLLSVVVLGSGTGNDDEYNVFTIHRSIDSDPTCASTQIGSAFTAFTTNATAPLGSSVTFRDVPGTAGNIRYTVCSSVDAFSSSSTVDNVIDIITVTLQETGS